jgi:hypothetical protein
MAPVEALRLDGPRIKQFLDSWRRIAGVIA